MSPSPKSSIYVGVGEDTSDTRLFLVYKCLRARGEQQKTFRQLDHLEVLGPVLGAWVATSGTSSPVGWEKGRRFPDTTRLTPKVRD